MSVPKITVIVPIYKVEPYLDRCVKSIVNQTYKNLEIILVDDGSPDRCPQICNEWQKQDDRIVVIHKTNGGLGDARNSGLDKATGDFISFIDSDDFITSDFIETLYNTCVEHDCDIVQCDFVKVYNDDIVPYAKEDDVSILDNIQMLWKLYSEINEQTASVCTKLYKKRLWKNVRFPIEIHHEDEAVIHKIIYNANKIALLSNKMYMYYQRSNSIMNKKFNIYNLDIIRVNELRIRFFDKVGLQGHKENAIDNYVLNLLFVYNKCKTYIPNSRKIQKEIMSKYKRALKEVLLHERVPFTFKIKLIVCRFLPRLPAWLGKKWAS